MEKIKAIIVDDSPLVRFQLLEILESIDYEVIGEAENGEQAVEMVKELKPQMVTLDVVMPIKDGLTALEEIVEMENPPAIIMITAMGRKDSVVKAIKMGATDYIVKPFIREQVEKVFIKIKEQF